MNEFLRIVITLLLISRPAIVTCQTYSITTIAGFGNVSFSGDGGPALSARFDKLESIAVDPSGNLYLADSQNNRIRKIDTRGNIQTIAGTGNNKPTNETNRALTTDLQNPTRVRVDASGNVFVADHRALRKVTPEGGIIKLSEDARRVRVHVPEHMATDSHGNLFVSDAERTRIRKITPTRDVSIVYEAPAKPEGETEPAREEGDNRVQGFNVGGMAVDSHSHLFVIDTSTDQVYRVAEPGVLQLVAGNGKFNTFERIESVATKVSFSNATEIGFDRDDNLYILDYNYAEVRKVSPNGAIQTVICRRETENSVTYTRKCSTRPTIAAAYSLAGMAVAQSGDLFLTDANDQVCEVTPDGVVSIISGVGTDFTGDDGPAIAAVLEPSSVSVDKQGNVYVGDNTDPMKNNLDRCRIRKITPAGIINTFAGVRNCGYSGDGGQARLARLSGAGAMAFDSRGYLYFADGGDGRVRKISPEGIISTVFGEKSGGGWPNFFERRSPAGLAFDKDDNLYLADLKKNRVLRVSPQNTVTLVAGNGSEGFSGDGGPATAARLNSPTALAVDQNGNVYISDSGNNTIRKVTPDGLISSLTGAQLNAFTGDDGPAKLAHLSDPRGIALDSAGNLYIADSGNNRVRKISATSQIISTIAGSGVDGFGGDGDLATHALLDFPTDIAVDSSGNVYVVDSGNHRLRNLTPLKTQTKP